MRSLKFVLFGLLLAFTTGCAGLYNQQRHEAAQAAQKSFAEAKLVESIKEERVQNAEILARELEIVERQMVATRNRDLLDVLGSKTPQAAHELLGGLVNGRMDELANNARTPGSGENLAIQALAKISTFEESRDALAERYQLRRGADDPQLECLGEQPDVSADAKPEWEAYQTRCKGIGEIHHKLAPFQTGSLFAISQELAKNDAARMQITNEIRERVAAFKAEAKRLKNARDAGLAPDLTKLATRARDDLRGVNLKADAVTRSGIADARLLGTVEWLNEQKSSLDVLLDAVATGKASNEADDAVAFASILPGITTDLTTAVRYPRVSALVLESERLRIDRDRAQQQLARVDEEVRLLRAQRDVLLGEWNMLQDAAAFLRECSPRALANKKRFHDLPDDCRQGMAAALLSYSTAWTLGRIPADKITWGLINLEHERTLDATVSALQQWNNLVVVPLDALVANYGSGVRPASIGRALSGLELGAIAVGVH